MPSPTRPVCTIALTVTDLDASIAWYERIFGLTFRMEEPHPGGTGNSSPMTIGSSSLCCTATTPTPGRRSPRRRRGSITLA